MNHTSQFPYIKVYSGSKNRVRYVWENSTSQHGMYEGAIVGEKLIDFLLTDLLDDEKRILMCRLQCVTKREIKQVHYIN